MVIFKNLTKAPKSTFPKGIEIECTKGSTMKRGIMKSRYSPELSKKKAGMFFQQVKYLLITYSPKIKFATCSWVF